MQLGDVRRRRRVCTLVAVAGRVRPSAWMPCPAVALLSLLDQQCMCASLPPRPSVRIHMGQLPRRGRVRESGLWLQSLRQVGSPPPDSHWVVVADRGADIYNYLLACQQRGLGFVYAPAKTGAS